MNKNSLTAIKISIISSFFTIVFLMGMTVFVYLKDGKSSIVSYVALLVIPIHVLAIFISFKKHRIIKEKLVLKRGFSTPVSADGKVLPDNSHELEKMFDSGYSRPKPQQLIILKILLLFDIALIAGALIIGYIIPDFLEVIYFPVIPMFIVIFMSTFIQFVKLKQKILDQQNNITNNKIDEVQIR